MVCPSFCLLPQLPVQDLHLRTFSSRCHRTAVKKSSDFSPWMQQPASARGAETANCYIVKKLLLGDLTFAYLCCNQMPAGLQSINFTGTQNIFQSNTIDLAMMPTAFKQLFYLTPGEYPRCLIFRKSPSFKEIR